MLRKGKALGREGYRRGASNLDPVCRVQVLLDVPVKQTKTKLGAAGASHPKLKAYKDCVLVLHFGLDKKAWGTLFLPAGEGDQSLGMQLFGGVGQLSGCTSPFASFPKTNHYCIKYTDSIGLFPPVLLPASP